MVQELNFQPINDRIPPQNIDAEEAILGGILLDPDAIARILDILKPEAFYLSAHQEIFRAALTLTNQGTPVDLMSITTWLQDRGLLDKIGGQSKLVQLVDRTVSAVNIDQYAQLVTDKYLRRKLISAGHQISQLGHDTKRDLEHVLDEAEQKVFSITQVRPSQGLTAAADILTKTFSEIEERSVGMALPGLACGFYDLDGKTQGFQRSDLIIVAGRPSMGKTAVCLSFARNIAAQYKLPVAVFSLEMSKEQIIQRLLASEARIESGRLRSGRISQQDWEPLGQAISRLSELRVFVDDTPNISVNEMRSRARKLQAEQGGALGMILIDYLQLMEGTGSENRVQELSRITRSLKGLARELNVPIVALSQLSRNVESRSDKRPMMSDLRESGCLAGDTLVTLADSGTQVQIQDLVGQSNVAVWALNEATGKLERAMVSHAFSTGVKPVSRLTTRLGRSIRATHNHKFLTIHGWRRLDQLQIGDRIALPRQIPSSQLLSTKTQSMSDAELGLLAHLIGDGCTLPRHAIQYTTREADLAQTVSDLAVQVFGNQIKPRIKQERDWYQVYLTANYRLTHGVRNPVTQWLDGLSIFGLRSHEKYVPSVVFEQSQRAIALFLCHLWSTDGAIHLVKGKRSRPITFYASSSRQLAQDVQSLLLRLGINARLKRVSQGSKGRDQYHVIVTGKPDLEQFVAQVGAVGCYRQQNLATVAAYLQNCVANTNRDIIPFQVWQLYATPAMQEQSMSQRQMQAGLEIAYCGTSLYQQNLSRDRTARLAQVVQSPKLLQLAESDIYWDEIYDITANGEAEVYDLTVPGLHNFVANNITVHNSIEQDADLVMMLYREEYYNPDTPDRGIAEIIITKHRNGPTGTVKLLFEPQFTRFLNLAAPNRDY